MIRSVDVIEVIKVVSTRGLGNAPHDPVREVIEYWSKHGEFLVAKDPLVRLEKELSNKL